MTHAVSHGIAGVLLLSLTTCSPAPARPDNPPAEDLRFVLNTLDED
jgi:hypothetical protein